MSRSSVALKASHARRPPALSSLSQYSEEFYYFEALVCLQKISVAGVLVFLERSPVQQQSLGLIISVVWSHIYFSKAPFAAYHDNMIARVSSVSLALILLGALLLPNGVPPTGWRRDVGAPLLIAFTAAPILVVAWAIGVELYGRARECVRKSVNEPPEAEEKQEDEPASHAAPELEGERELVSIPPEVASEERSAAASADLQHSCFDFCAT